MRSLIVTDWTRLISIVMFTTIGLWLRVEPIHLSQNGVGLLICIFAFVALFEIRSCLRMVNMYAYTWTIKMLKIFATP